MLNLFVEKLITIYTYSILYGAESLLRLTPSGCTNAFRYHSTTTTRRNGLVVAAAIIATGEWKRTARAGRPEKESEQANLYPCRRVQASPRGRIREGTRFSTVAVSSLPLPFNRPHIRGCMECAVTQVACPATRAAPYTASHMRFLCYIYAKTRKEIARSQKREFSLF